MHFTFIYSFVFLALFSCDKKVEKIEPPVEEDVFVVFDYSMDNLVMSDNYFHEQTFGGTILSSNLVEASGLAVSRSNPSIIWSHNDSGHANRLFAVGENGEDYGVFIPQGTGSRDWEDICIGPGPVDGVNYIYIADIGDNHAQYNYIIVYRFPEPDISGLDSSGVNYVNSDLVERMEFTYPDGPRDAETLMIDPWTKDLYFVSKRDAKSIIYKSPYPQQVNARTELKKMAQLPFNWAVAGDISSDGKKIVIKDRYKIYCWERIIGETIIEALKRKPVQLPYIPEPQGESFGWTPDGTGYFTLSEKSGPNMPDLYFYKKHE
jgi:hypothetical protein